MKTIIVETNHGQVMEIEVEDDVAEDTLVQLQALITTGTVRMK